MHQVIDLREKAVRLQDVSKVLYACLESRTLLEIISANKLLCSVASSEREELRESMRPRHGINKANNQIKGLKLKLQEFGEAIGQSGGFSFPVYSFSESEKIQDILSQYIHSYTRLEQEMQFGSNYINTAISAIDDAIRFASDNLIYNEFRGTYILINFEMNSLPNWAKIILNDWKQEGKIKNKEELKLRIKNAVEDSKKV